MLEQDLKRPKTVKQHITALTVAFIFVLTPFLMLETLLRAVDPWGLYFYNDMVMLGNSLIQTDSRDFMMPDGEYQFARWTATIEDGTRELPTPENPTCRMVLLGDSVTFGYGVNDDEVWGYYLTQSFPDVEFVNAGFTAYNSLRVRQAYDAHPLADAYLYLVIDDDFHCCIYPAGNTYVNEGRHLPYLVQYTQQTMIEFRDLRSRSAQPTDIQTKYEDLAATGSFDRFLDDIAALSSDPRVQIVNFENSLTTFAILEAGYDAPIIQFPREYPISLVDGHLNPQGNQVLEQRLRPIVEDMIAENCPE